MRLKRIPLFLLTALLIVSCAPAVIASTPTIAATTSQITLPTATARPTLTDTPAPTPTITLTPSTTPCGWNWAYGDSYSLSNQLQVALDDAQIAGTVKTQSYGETGGDTCSYHEQGVSAEITVYVVNTTDLPTLTELATRIEAILQGTTSKDDHKASLTDGKSVLLFKGATGSTEKDCRWDFGNQSCQ